MPVTKRTQPNTRMAIYGAKSSRARGEALALPTVPPFKAERAAKPRASSTSPRTDDRRRADDDRRAH